MLNFYYKSFFKKLDVNNQIYQVFPFSLEKQKLNELEKKILIEVYYEEDIARNVYNYFYKLYNLKLFKRSHFYESVHKEAVKIVLEKNSVDLRQHKNEQNILIREYLKENGKKNLVEALKSALLLELNDIYEINKHIKHVKNIEIFSVLSFLLRGSYNHYNMFKRSLFVHGKNVCNYDLKNFNKFIDNKFLCFKYPYKIKTWKYYKHFDFIKKNQILLKNIKKMNIN